MRELIDKIYFLWKDGKSLEAKFASYQGYKHNSIIQWKNQTGLPWSLIFKILSNFEIYTAPKIRSTIRQIVYDNEDILSKENCFITGFGNAGKSGDIILYDFSHTIEVNQSKIKKTWELNSLPEGSTIIFVEDIIGTGTQSVDFIHNKVNQIIKPSHIPYLLSLCATTKGIENVTENTHFTVLPGIILGEEHQHYTEQSKVFSTKEKEKIKSVNDMLKNSGSFDFDLGLMLAFYFTIPNNSMPIFWKDGYSYTDNKGQKKQWNALLPRRF
jgi:hypothetical protein